MAQLLGLYSMTLEVLWWIRTVTCLLLTQAWSERYQTELCPLLRVAELSRTA